MPLGIVLGLAVGAGFIVYFHFKNQFDPIYHGRRILTWADQAIWDEDPSTRQEAVQVLLEAVEDMEGEPRTQLLLYFVCPRRGSQEKTVLPKELLPFLVRAMKIEDRSGYPAMALRKVHGPATATALIDVVRHEESARAREQATYVLRDLALENKLGPAKEQAMAALREALQDENPKVRERASEALKYINPSRQ